MHMTTLSDGILFDPQKHEYRTAAGVYVPSVTQILARCGLCDYSFVEEEKRTRSLNRGKDVHWMLQLQDEGVLKYRTVPMRLRPYRAAYLAWLAASGFEPVWIEKQFISRFGFAGTLDRWGHLPPTEQFPAGSQAVVDIKTGDVQEWVKYQLAAYVTRVTDYRPFAAMVRRIALALRPDGTYQVKEFPGNKWNHDFSVFMEGKRRTDAGHVDQRRDN